MITDIKNVMQLSEVLFVLFFHFNTMIHYLKFNCYTVDVPSLVTAATKIKHVKNVCGGNVLYELGIQSLIGHRICIPSQFSIANDAFVRSPL